MEPKNTKKFNKFNKKHIKIQNALCFLQIWISEIISNNFLCRIKCPIIYSESHLKKITINLINSKKKIPSYKFYLTGLEIGKFLNFKILDIALKNIFSRIYLNLLHKLACGMFYIDKNFKTETCIKYLEKMLINDIIDLLSNIKIIFFTYD
jgi:hypothetical protein